MTTRWEWGGLSDTLATPPLIRTLNGRMRDLSRLVSRGPVFPIAHPKELQGAIDAASDVSGVVELQSGTEEWLLADTIIPRPNVTVRGGGAFATQLRFTTSGSSLFAFTGTEEAEPLNFTLQNLELFGYANGDGIAVRLRNCDHVYLDHVLIDHFRVGLWADWGQNIYAQDCQFVLNERGVHLGGDVTPAEDPAIGAGIRGGAFGPNFMDTAVLWRCQFAEEQLDVNYCGSQYALGGLLMAGCRLFESAGAGVAGKEGFVRISGAQSAHLFDTQIECPNVRYGVKVTDTGEDGETNGPSWGVTLSDGMILTTSTSAQAVLVDSGTANIHGMTFVAATGAYPITLDDPTNPSRVGKNTYMTFVNGAVPTIGHSNKITIGTPSVPHQIDDWWTVVEDGVTAPATATGFARMYVDTADGDLKIVFGDGTVKTIVTDT